MKYKEGEFVIIKLSGLEVAAVIKSVLKDNEYIVQFESGSDTTIHARQIRELNKENTVRFEVGTGESDSTISTRRSPSRRSPARAASPPRSPSRRTRIPSPARKRSSSRKSHTVKTTTTASDQSIIQPSFPRRRRPIDQDSEKAFNSATEIINDLIKKNDYEPEATKDFVQEERQFILHLKAQEQVLQDLGKFSDDDIRVPRKSVEKEQSSEPKSLIPSKEFGGVIGTLALMFIIPASIVSLHVFCDKESSDYTKTPNFEEYKLLKTYFDINVWFIYIGYMVLIAVLSLLPFVGKKVNSQPSKNKIRSYRMNGLFTAFMIYAIFATLEWNNIPMIDFIYDNYFKFLITALIFGAILSTVVYVKSFYEPISNLNTHAVTYNFIYDFFMGREVNPTILGLDIKMIMIRSALIGVLLLNSMFLYKSLDINFSLEDTLPSIYDMEFSPTFLISCLLQTMYVLDMLVFETALTTTFELQYEGSGYMTLVGYAACPFMSTAVTRYLLESEMEGNVWILVSVLFLYTSGYIIYRASNAQKNAFRLNPYDPALANMESIPSNHGKRLLVSGYWGWVRHPNYLGDILMHTAMAGVCWWSPAALSVLAIIPLLVHRAIRVDEHCNRRYGAAWTRYCQRVQYRIIPRVY